MQNKSPIKDFLSTIWSRKKISADELFFLLQYDEKIKNEILSIANDSEHKQKIDLKEIPVEKNKQRNSSVERSIDKPVISKLNLEPEQELLKILEEDKELAKNWIDYNVPLDRQIVQLIVFASQWNNIQQLWKNIAKRCQKRKEKSTERELKFLQGCLNLHNLQWVTGKAKLDNFLEGETYDSEIHQRASTTPKGENIELVWLFGLKNTNGKLDKDYKSIVTTK